MRRAILLGVLLAQPVAAAPPRLPTSLVQALAAYDRATIAGDTKALARLVSDDYRLVNSDASVQRKGSYLADFRVPGFRIDRYTLTEPFMRASRDAALTGGLLRLGWTQAGQRHARTVRIAHWWIRDGGRWRIAYTQLTRVPDKP